MKWIWFKKGRFLKGLAGCSSDLCTVACHPIVSQREGETRVLPGYWANSSWGDYPLLVSLLVGWTSGTINKEIPPALPTASILLIYNYLAFFGRQSINNPLLAGLAYQLSPLFTWVGFFYLLITIRIEGRSHSTIRERGFPRMNDTSTVQFLYLEEK